VLLEIHHLEINHHQVRKMTTDSPFAPTRHPVHYNTVGVNELDVFYREAGSKTAPTILLLH